MPKETGLRAVRIAIAVTAATEQSAQLLGVVAVRFDSNRRAPGGPCATTLGRTPLHKNLELGYRQQPLVAEMGKSLRDYAGLRPRQNTSTL